MDAVSVERVFTDFRGRRAALVKALTTDVEDFIQKCDPEKENLCLFGFPNEIWEVNIPEQEVPPELPEPVIGINFAKDFMHVKDWLLLIACHSDSWLLAVAFYFGTKLGFDKNDRKCLYSMINELPTVYEVVNGKSCTPPPIPSTYESSNIPMPIPKKVYRVKVPKIIPKKAVEEEDEDDNDDNDESSEYEEDENGDALCGACGKNDGNSEFWIYCDICERWFHGKCVKVTPARAEHIHQYKCPSCSNKRGGRAR